MTDDTPLATMKPGSVREMPPAPAQPPTAMDTIRDAVREGYSPEGMRELVELQKIMRAEDAKAAFFAARAHLQAVLPPVVKSRAMDRGRGGKIAYASLDDVERAVRPACTANGFSYSWDVTETDTGVVVKCTLSHAQGHEVPSHFPVRVESSGGMNAAQSMASAVQYGKRNSLCSILGVSTTDMVDDDGEAAGAGPTVTPDQAADLIALCEDVGADAGRVIGWVQTWAPSCSSWEDVPASGYTRLVQMLERKRGAA